MMRMMVTLIAMGGIAVMANSVKDIDAGELSDWEMEQIVGASDCCESVVETPCGGGGIWPGCVQSGGCPTTWVQTAFNYYYVCNGTNPEKDCVNGESILCKIKFAITSNGLQDDEVCDVLGCTASDNECMSCPQGAVISRFYSTDHTCETI